MSTIGYAIEITTSTAVTDADYGIVGGVFRFITGRPGYDGNAPYPTGEAGIGASTLTAHWFEGWLVDKSVGSAERSIDISLSGDYGTMGGFSFNLAQSKATDAFWHFILDKGIHFTNRAVQAYVVIDDVFYYLWNGVVENNPYDDSEYTFSCQDKFRSVHKQMPSQIISKSSTDEQFGDDSQGDVVPLIYGDIKYAKLMNVSGDPYYEPLMTLANPVTGEYLCYQAPMTYFDRAENKMNIYTANRSAIVDAAITDDHRLYVASGKEAPDAGVGFEILTHRAVIIRTVPPVMWALQITLRDNPGIWWGTEETSSTTASLSYPTDRIWRPAWGSGEVVTNDAWWVRIGKLVINYKIASNGVINLLRNTANVPQLYQYSEDDKMYLPVSDKIVSVTYDSGTIKLHSARTMDLDGRVTTLERVPFTLTAMKYQRTVATAADIAKVTDMDRTTSITMDMVPHATRPCVIDFYIMPDPSHDWKDYNKLYIAFDLDVTSPVVPWALEYSAQVLDEFDAAVTGYDDFEAAKLYPDIGYVDETTCKMNLIPQDVYDSAEGDDNDEGDSFFAMTNLVKGADGKWYGHDTANPARVRETLEIPTEVFEGMSEGRRRKLKVTINTKAYIHAGEEGTVSIKEVCMFGEKMSSLNNDDIYVSTRGGSGITYNNTVYRVFKDILETQDGIASADIDYGNLQATRDDWHVGRQITSRKSSFDYLKELCQHSFVGITPGRNGKRRLSAWLEDTTSVADHSESTVVRGSVRDVKKTPISRCYNDIVLKYNYDPGRDKYTRTMFVTRAADASYPTLTGTNPAWTDCVGGLSSDCWADGKVLWGRIHEGYSQTNQISGQVPSQLAQLPWFVDVSTMGEIPGIQHFQNTNSSAFKYLDNLTYWATVQKDQVTFQLPITSANLVLELLQPVTWTDTILTNGTARTGWVVKISVNPDKGVMQVTVMLKGWEQGGVEDRLIIERGTTLNTDTITERGTALNTDTYTEKGAT